LLTHVLDGQVEAEAPVGTILGELRMANHDPSALLLIDRELAGPVRAAAALAAETCWVAPQGFRGERWTFVL